MVKKIIVKKFGGTSVGTPSSMHQVLDIIQKDTTEIKIVVLSALAKTTNHLISIEQAINLKNTEQAKVILQDLKVHYQAFLTKLFAFASNKAAEVWVLLKEKYFAVIEDYIMSMQCEQKEIVAMGEYMSTTIFSALLDEKKIEHEWLDAFQFMKLNEDGQVDYPFIQKSITAIIDRSNRKLFITQGFICQNHLQKMDNLQRGGSDFTASILSACVDAISCEIWTDIDGVHNNDPRVVKHTKSIQQLCFDEASELAYFGAKVLHPTCIAPAQKKNIPVKILNTLQPQAVGTTISDQNLVQGAKALAAKDNIVAIRIKSHKMLMAYGFLKTIFAIFEKYRTSIDMVTTSEVAVSLTIDDISHLDKIKKELETVAIVEIDYNMSIVCVVGFELHKSEDLLAKIFHTLKPIPIRMVSYGGSKNNVSLLVAEQFKSDVLQKLHDTLFY